MTISQNLWHIIAIVIVLDNLYNDFNITTANILESRNKTID